MLLSLPEPGGCQDRAGSHLAQTALDNSTGQLASPALRRVPGHFFGTSVLPLQLTKK